MLLQSTRTPPLTAEQNQLVLSHLKLVLHLVQTHGQSKKWLHSDLVCEGNIALCIAASRFDPKRGLKFSTYAGWWVRAAIFDCLLRSHNQVRFGTRKEERAVFFNLGRARRLIGDDSGELAK